MFFLLKGASFCEIIAKVPNVKCYQTKVPDASVKNLNIVSDWAII